MSTRPARSSSIPIPRSFPSTSPSRNIEDAITIPFAVPRRYSSTRGSPDDSRGGVSRTVRREPGNSPVRPTARSYPRTSTMLSRSTPRITTFEPRIVRADATRSTDPTCSPTSSPSRTRRTSTGRAPSSNRTSSVHFPSQSSPVAPFTRPAYLEHAALRHLLQADSHSILPPLRKPEASYRAQPYSSLEDSDEDASPPPPEAGKRTSSIPAGEEPLHLPTRWSDGRHHSLNISSDGRDLTFQGTHSTADRDGVAGAARTDHPIPPACGIYYFEVEVRSKLSTAHISIGLAAGDVKLSRLPGWEPNSWGYHGDDGRSFASEKNGTVFGPTYGSGDIVGCGLDFTSGRVFFTKNGTFIGHVFENVGRNSKLYPSVGLKNSNDSIRVNLGQDAFKYDIEFHVQNQRSSAWASLLKQPLHLSVVHEGEAPPPPVATTDGMVEDETKSSLSRLVMSYLGHHGYSKTLVALQKDAHQTPRSDMDTESGAYTDSNHDEGYESRTHIVQCVMSGDLDTAISETQLHHPSVLEAEDGIMLFKMRCRKFVELVMETVELKKALQSRASLDNPSEDMADEMDVDGDVSMEADIDRASTSEYEAALSNAIVYGQSLTNDYKADRRAEVKDIFMQTFGILAFEDPRDVPSVAAVVGNEAKVSLANQLNQAILRSQGRPPEPALETFYRHTAVCMQQLALLGVGFAPFVDMKREFLEG